MTPMLLLGADRLIWLQGGPNTYTGFPGTAPIYVTGPSFIIHNTLFRSQKCPSLDIKL